MILLAECRDGFGNNTFFDWFRHTDLEVFEAALRAGYEINGQTAFSTLQKAQRFSIILVSSFSDQQVDTMGMIPATSLDDALLKAKELLPMGWLAFVMPEGGCILPVMNE